METADNKQVVQNMYAEIARRNFDGFLGCLADDVEWKILGKAKMSGTTLHGRGEVAAKLREIAAETDGEVSSTLHAMIAEGDHVVVQATRTATMKSGERFEYVYCIVYRVRRGKVDSVMEFVHTTDRSSETIP